jgi:hypothetical protein
MAEQPFIYSAIRIPAIELTPEEQEREDKAFQEYYRKWTIHYNKVKGIKQDGEETGGL